jgi:hypothetical protein
MDIKFDANKLAHDMATALKPLADKIGSGATHVYEVAVKNAYISGIEHWLYIAFWVGLCIPALYYTAHFHKKAQKDSGFYGGVTITIIVAVILLCLALSNLGDAMHYTFAPEYMAITDLLRVIKGQ